MVVGARPVRFAPSKASIPGRVVLARGLVAAGAQPERAAVVTLTVVHAVAARVRGARSACVRECRVGAVAIVAVFQCALMPGRSSGGGAVMDIADSPVRINIRTRPRDISTAVLVCAIFTVTDIEMGARRDVVGVIVT